MAECLRLDGTCPARELFLASQDRLDELVIYLINLDAREKDPRKNSELVDILNKGVRQQRSAIKEMGAEILSLRQRNQLCPKCPWRKNYGF
ncbi:MAG: hypothetical protein UX91_C0006G0185 [Candidatus Amesbacteria bacterium GW2011_GWB1_47_19]|nr:MAG: hypothetical protein UW51_C0002G0186 [Candidatus Amesbacteria bacterium GW2011_GWA1_44_24]KKU31223.1 MAG: hypothetical protein UX46_C0006G0015 [Candidatus Amesbacteria bacterium GW2011_GWC1_46_24]KKU67123.1 MAG: hypothetical protein UX91_C0006G0185 [Candidatus Amesbacteria bacterium GW2011_GWB1_47_19]OGD05479.1 MAG: hypothetical protein A2379_00785 [Candidatus Amesbacteria bacterium RIFOXYB1_FULL_47_13]HBC72993.1 hypothetical protein [Candidatus Amesbacteria bacterium]